MENDVTTSVAEFKREMKPPDTDEETGNPLGDRIYIESSGPYIIEVYESDFMSDDGKYGKVTVFRKVRPDEEHFRAFKEVADKRCRTPADAKNAAAGIQSNPDQMEHFIESNG